MNKQDIINLLKDYPDLRDKLFCRGFLLTDSNINDSEYPFYGLWQKQKINQYTLLVSPKQKYYFCEKDDRRIVLIGHAYNPFKLIANENEILNELIKKENISLLTDELNQLTGIFALIFIYGQDLYVFGDATGMQTVFYSVFNKQVFVSSHTNCIGDLLDLEQSSYVRELTKYKFFRLFGNSMPGNITQFSSVKRLVPNHYICLEEDKIDIKRFYYPQKYEIDEEEIINQVSSILHNSLELISKKWKKPAISLTGGCDSKTTLACANGLYDKFSYFSYISSEAEEIDAEGARKICESIKQKHTTYNISNKDNDFALNEPIKTLMFWNCGGVYNNNSNDVRKRCYFLDTKDFDVEVKSWVSEIGRAYYSKRFNGRIDFGKRPTPRKCTTLYKVFLFNRKLLKKTDEIFKDYLEKYFQQDDKKPIEWQEQFFWEHRMASWNGLVISGEHKISYDITIPYNNRKLLELLLSAQIIDRLKDNVYKKVRLLMNEEVDRNNINITNIKHTKNRARLENIYYLFRSIDL